MADIEQISHVVEDDSTPYSTLIRSGRFQVLRRRYTLTRRPLLAAVGVLLLLSILSFIYIFRDIYTGKQSELGFHLFDDARRVDQEDQFADDQLTGWRVVNLTDSDEATPQNTIFRQTLAEAFFTPDCAEAWVATGTLCDRLTKRDIPPDIQKALKLSTIHTWVNGSDLLLQDQREAYAKDQQSVTGARTRIGNLQRHFRSHGEFVYSLRSILRAFHTEEIDGLHLVTTDLPLNTTVGMRVGQVPTWLNLESRCTPHIHVHHHSQIFKLSEREAHQDAATWREHVLPSFNSIGIESQLVTLAPELTDTILYFNDDFFLTSRLRRSDFSSPLFGPVFRMQSTLLVSSTAKGTSKADPEGEWPSLTYANWLLDQRFGERKRPYLQHFVKTFSAPLLQEVASIWAEEITESAEIRFRGADHGKALGLAFLATHYVVERHREALLWSFIVARSDRDSSQTLSVNERRELLADIGFATNQSNDYVLVVPEPRRRLNDGVNHTLTKAGLVPPLATDYSFISHEGGFPYIWLNGRPVLGQGGRYVVIKPIGQHLPNRGWPFFRSDDVNQSRVACTLDVRDCFGYEFMSEDDTIWPVEDTFKRVAFEKPQCGDCIIMGLLGASGMLGFSAFLPEPSSDIYLEERVALSMSKNWRNARYDMFGGRTRAISLLQRYSYAIGDSVSDFVPIRASPLLPKRLEALLGKVYNSSGPAFIVLNDELSDQVSAQKINDVDHHMHQWMDTIWPEKACWER